MPARTDRSFYEKVCLESFQAGLAWSTILYRREALRSAFCQFEMDEVAAFNSRDVARLMRDPSLIRNRRKIEAAINNAKRARELRADYGSLAAFFWSFEPPEHARPPLVTADWLRANPVTHESRQLAKALKDRGWIFVGPTGMYALMQALGLVNDHVHSCTVRAKVEAARAAFQRPQLARDTGARPA